MGAIARKRIDDPVFQAVLNALVRSTLIFGLNRVTVAATETPYQMLIIELWGGDSKKQRLNRFLAALWECGFVVDVRRNPPHPDPSSSYMYQFSSRWRRFDLTPYLSPALKRSQIHIIQNAPFKSVGDTITINPSIIRGWILEMLPSSVQVRAIDFPEIQTKKKRAFKTVALVTCTVPEDSWTNLFESLDILKERFGIDVAINPVPSYKPLKERFATYAPDLQNRSMIRPSDIPILVSALKSSLRWRTHRGVKRSRDIRASWFSIDQKNVFFREDVISLFRSHKALGVRVAIPDITTGLERKVVGRTVRQNKTPGAFYKLCPTPSWVFEFKVVQGRLIPLAAPYRDIVINRHEFQPEEGDLKENKLYQKMKRNLQCRSDYEVVEKLMHGVEHSAGSVLNDRGFGFLIHHDDKERLLLLRSLLEREGFTIGATTLRLKHKLFRLIRQLQAKRAYHLLPLVAAQLGDDSVVTVGEHRGCSLKPQRGTREQINQHILSAAIDRREDALPHFIRALLRQPTRSIDARAALRIYEEERTLATLFTLIIKVLSEKRERKATVRYCSRGEHWVEVEGVKRLCLLRSDNLLIPGQKLFVLPIGFDTTREKFVFSSP